MKKILSMILLFAMVAIAAPGARNANQSNTFTATGWGTSVAATAIYYHQISWTLPVSSHPNDCMVGVYSSATGAWAGEEAILIPLRDCRVNSISPQVYTSTPVAHVRVKLTAWGGSTSSINVNYAGYAEAAAPPPSPAAAYITRVPATTLSAEFALSSLATGILANTTTTGTPVIVTPGTHLSYSAPTLSVDAATTNTSNAIVARDVNGDFTAGTITATLTGHASLDLPLTGGTLTGPLLFTDNTLDIGASGATRPRTGYFGTSVRTPLIDSAAAIALTPAAGSNVNITTSGAGDLVVNTNQFVVDSSTARVGIGTAAPAVPLHVVGGAEALRLQNLDAYISFYNSAGTIRTGYFQVATGASYFVNELNTPLSFATNNLPRLMILGGGNVGIGTTAPDSKLDVNLGAAGALQLSYNDADGSAATKVLHTLSSTGVYTVDSTGSAAGVTFPDPIFMSGLPADTAHTDTSVCKDTTTHELLSGTGTLGICLGSSRSSVKSNLQNLNVGLNEIMQLQPLSFNYRAGNGYDPTKTYYGFTAESVDPVLPILAPRDSAGVPLSVDLLGMVPLLVKAIQEQQEQITLLKSEVARLKAY